MSGLERTKGDAATSPMLDGTYAPERIGRYHGPNDPHKTIHFECDGQPIKAKGKVAAFLSALMAAGDTGVAHVDCLPWQLNPGDAARTLRVRGVRIETRKGKPDRWILRSVVREVQP